MPATSYLRVVCNEEGNVTPSSGGDSIGTRQERTGKLVNSWFMNRGSVGSKRS